MADLTPEQNAEVDEILKRSPGPLTPQVIDPPTEKKLARQFSRPWLNRPVPKLAQVGWPLVAGAAGTALGGPLAGAALAGGVKGALAIPSGGEPLKAGAVEAGGQLLGAGIAKGVGTGVAAMTQTRAYQAFAKHLEDQLTMLLQSKVPAWAGMPLLKMFHGQSALSGAYDASLARVISEGTGKQIAIPQEAAQKLGIATLGQIDVGPLNPRGLVVVEAADAARRMTGQWKKSPGAYHQIAQALDRAGIGDPQAREAYRWGSGALEYLNRTKALQGERYHPEKAMAGLTDLKAWEGLRRRGMEDFARVVRGTQPVPAQIIPGKESAVGSVGGEIGGAMVGSALGYPIAGLFAGRELGRALLGKQVRQLGVPQLPGVQLGQKVAPPVMGPLGGYAAGQLTGQSVPEENEPTEE